MLKFTSKHSYRIHSYRVFSTTPARLSLDKFYSEQKTDYTLSDERALEYMRMAADLSLISKFKDEQEMLQYKSDFQSALMFIKKLEEVHIPEGTEPLCNVLEFYGGNEEKMRSTEADFDNTDHSNF